MCILFFFFYSLSDRFLRWGMAMVFAVNEMNDNPMLLPNVTLKYAVHDVCFYIPRETKTALKILGPNFITTGIDGSGPQALIGAIRENSVFSFLPEVNCPSRHMMIKIIYNSINAESNVHALGLWFEIE